ncbi:MAG: hypothetical protein J6T10_13630 [Methanobrevibacter sp.]|nr:hypothetical protein [Methanobrevibacter sp.]
MKITVKNIDIQEEIGKIASYSYDHGVASAVEIIKKDVIELQKNNKGVDDIIKMLDDYLYEWGENEKKSKKEMDLIIVELNKKLEAEK